MANALQTGGFPVTHDFIVPDELVNRPKAPLNPSKNQPFGYRFRTYEDVISKMEIPEYQPDLQVATIGGMIPMASGGGGGGGGGTAPTHWLSYRTTYLDGTAITDGPFLDESQPD
jgi:hypothetical protein